MAARTLSLLQQFMHVHLKVLIALFTILRFVVQEIVFEDADLFLKKILLSQQFSDILISRELWLRTFQPYKLYHFLKDYIEWF